MTKPEHIDYWLKTALDDWEAANHLLEKKKFVQALFFSHLTLEKYCKANWVNDNNENYPPKTHNLVRLLKQTKSNLTEEQLMFLEEFNDFQLEGRYPDYVFAIHQRCNQVYTDNLFIKIKEIILCLQNKVQ